MYVSNEDCSSRLPEHYWLIFGIAPDFVTDQGGGFTVFPVLFHRFFVVHRLSQGFIEVGIAQMSFGRSTLRSRSLQQTTLGHISESDFTDLPVDKERAHCLVDARLRT